MKLECERRLAGSISEQAFDRPAGRHSLRIWYLSLVWKYTTGLLSRDRDVTRNETPSRRNAHLWSLDQVSVAQPPTLHRLGKRAIWSIVSRSLTLWQARNSATYRFRFLDAARKRGFWVFWCRCGGHDAPMVVKSGAGLLRGFGASSGIWWRSGGCGLGLVRVLRCGWGRSGWLGRPG